MIYSHPPLYAQCDVEVHFLREDIWAGLRVNEGIWGSSRLMVEKMTSFYIARTFVAGDNGYRVKGWMGTWNSHDW